MRTVRRWTRGHFGCSGTPTTTTGARNRPAQPTPSLVRSLGPAFALAWPSAPVARSFPAVVIRRHSQAHPAKAHLRSELPRMADNSRRIELSATEALDLLALVHDMREALTDSPLIGLILQIEDAEAVLIDRLFPNL